MSANDSEIEDAIDHLGEMETDEDVTTDTGESDATEDTIDSSTSTVLFRNCSFLCTIANTEREMEKLYGMLCGIGPIKTKHVSQNAMFSKWMSMNELS